MKIEITIEESQEETVVSTRFETTFETYWKDSYIDTGKYNDVFWLELKVLETVQEHVEELQDDIMDYYGEDR